MTLPAVFVYLSAKCLSNEFHGIYCFAKLSPKLLDRLFHRRRQTSPISNNITHRLFDGFQHLLHGNFTAGSRHRLSPPLLAENYDKVAALLDLPLGSQGFGCARESHSSGRGRNCSSRFALSFAAPRIRVARAATTEPYFKRFLSSLATWVMAVRTSGTVAIGLSSPQSWIRPL